MKDMPRYGQLLVELKGEPDDIGQVLRMLDQHHIRHEALQ